DPRAQRKVAERLGRALPEYPERPVRRQALDDGAVDVDVAIDAEDRRLRDVLLVDEYVAVAIVAAALERDPPRVGRAVGRERSADRSSALQFLAVDVAARADPEDPVVPGFVLSRLRPLFGLLERDAQPVRDRRIHGVPDEADAEPLGEARAPLVGGRRLRRVVGEGLVLALKAAHAEHLSRGLHTR